MSADGRCDKSARNVLFEVYGKSTTIPVGVFCTDHWASERARLRAAGQRTALQVLREDEAERCNWIPVVEVKDE